MYTGFTNIVRRLLLGLEPGGSGVARRMCLFPGAFGRYAFFFERRIYVNVVPLIVDYYPQFLQC